MIKLAQKISIVFLALPLACAHAPNPKKFTSVSDETVEKGQHSNAEGDSAKPSKSDVSGGLGNENGGSNGVTLNQDKADAVRNVVQSHSNEVLLCYSKQLATNPKLEGEIALVWSIDEIGRASVPVINREKTYFPDENVAKCIIDRIPTGNLLSQIMAALQLLHFLGC